MEKEISKKTDLIEKFRARYNGINVDIDEEIPDHDESIRSINTVFRFYDEKFDFDSLNSNMEESEWEVTHSITEDQRNFLKTFPGYKDHKETVHYGGVNGKAIMHRDYNTFVHKLIIHPEKLENYQDTINAIKGMFELGLGITCYPENDLPEGLIKRIKTIKKTKNLDKLD